eukprot:g1719.t1
MEVDNSSSSSSSKAKAAPLNADPSVSHLPWIEKYRPKSFTDLVSHEEILTTISRLTESGKLPHLLLYGPPGTGKTSTVLAIAAKLYGSSARNANVLELNASDERGIDVVRNRIKDFAGTRKLFSKGHIKLVVLDEADAMTSEAQFALRRVIEKYTKTCRFCLICNFVSKIIPALQSRCTKFRFAPLVPSQILPRLQYVIAQEKINITQEGMEMLLKISKGDMRKVLNILQSTYLANQSQKGNNPATMMATESGTESGGTESKTVTNAIGADDICRCAGTALPSQIDRVFNSLLNDKMSDSIATLKDLRLKKGIALNDIVTHLHERITVGYHLPPASLCYLLAQLAAIEDRICAGSDAGLQENALAGVFKIAVEIMGEEGSKSTVTTTGEGTESAPMEIIS